MVRTSKSEILISKVKNGIIFMTPLVFIIVVQILWIVSVGDKISGIGGLLFVLQSFIYVINIKWGLPELFERKQYLQFSVKLIAIVAIYVFMRSVVILRYSWTTKALDFIFSIDQLMFAFIHLFLVLGTSYFVGFYRQSHTNAIKKEAALRASIESLTEMRRLESIIYQMQLSPHFTFNTLNTIRLESAGQLPHVSRAAELLAIILRGYLHDPKNVPKIGLMEDIEILKTYLELQQYLKKKHHFFKFSSEIPEEHNLTIPPGMLLTLTDNVVKYGVTNEEEYPALIEVMVTDNRLTFHTWNMKMISIIKGNGLGQKNVTALLEHYYPNRFTLEIKETEDYYDLKLDIDL